ncbi:MAG: efflux RND transporter periplasmic adaptor subunit [Candidatus Magasanikbacteria bacterium]|nr:efflux RND transporter periplasmic adaptor subunit [Candidatus Magasanikbacteria bacterium]
MRFLNKKNIIIAVVILLVIAVIVWKQTSTVPKEITTALVTKGELIQSVEPSGSVKSKTEINLNFDTVGRIAKILVKVGDQVKEKQLLANLDSRNLDSAVNQASADLARAQGNLSSYLAGSTPEVIAQYEADVQKAEANLDKSKIDLNNLKASLEQNYKNAYTNQINNLQGSITPIETAMTDMDSILGLENIYANDVFDKAIINLDNSSFYFASATKSFTTSRIYLNDAKLAVNALTSNSALELIDSATLKVKMALEAVAVALSDTWTVLDKIDVSNPNNSISVSTINSSKITIDTDRASVTAKKTVVLGGEQNIASAKLNFGLEAGSSAASQVSQYEANVKISEATLKAAQAALDSKEAPPRQVDLESYRAAVQSAGASLLAAEANRSKAFIYAPVNGVITQKNNEVGESNSTAKPVLVMLADSDYEIEVNVAESDIAKVQLSQITDITLDAFGDDHIFKGKVMMVDPAETLISDVVYYKVKISIDKDESLKTGQNITDQHLKDIKSGMTASVTIFTNRKDGVLIIPERAVIAKDNKKFVRVLVDKKKQTIVEKEVQTGLRGNEGMIEIVSGLNEGEEVVTFIKS